jgi:DNA-binding NtrC family response regulator
MLVAEAIHKMSARKHGPYHTAGEYNNDILGDVFGDEKAPGLVFGAEGGTLLVKALHRLEHGEKEELASFLKRGMPGPEGTRTDTRVIASTEPYKKGWPFSGCFRTILNLPPLRERREDIKPLAEHFLQESVQMFATEAKGFSPDALKALKAHKWPGNVGELKNAVRRACLLSRGDLIEPQHITTDGTTFCTIKDFLETKLTRYIKDLIRLEESGLHKTVMSEVEKSLIELVLKETGGNQVKAAKTMGITRTTLRSKIKSFGLNGHPQKRKKK